MTYHTPNPEFLVGLVADALSHARVARELLHSAVIPRLAPLRRGIAEDIQRRLSGDHFISEAFVRDLSALLEFLADEIDKGIRCDWVADEHDLHGGHHVRQLDDRARALSNASAHIADLGDAIADALDFAKAGRMAEDLIDC